MLKFLQDKLQSYVNQKLSDVQAGFWRDRRTIGQIVNIHWIMKKPREFQKNIYICLIDDVKVFDCVGHNKLEIFKEMEIPEHLTCLLRNLYVGSVQLNHSVVSNSLWAHGLQHTRLPCPSPTPRARSHSCPSSQWCHPTISASVVLFSSHLQSFPALGFFSISQFFTSGGQRVGASALATVLPMIIKDWFPLDWLVGSPCSPS